VDTLLRAGFSNAVAASLMGIVVACFSRLFARRPALLHGLWVLVLLRLVTPPIYEVPIPWTLASSAPPSIPSAEMSSDAAPVVLIVRGPGLADSPETAELRAEGCDDRLASPDPALVASPMAPTTIAPIALGRFRWIGAAWLGGSAIVLLLAIRRIRRFQKVLTMARPASWVEQEWVDDWARRLGLRRGPDLWWVPGRVSPMIWCIGFRPRLLIPEDFWKRLDAQQRSTLVAHEMAHLRRGDHLVRLLELLVTALFWWHPLVWWMRGPLREAEERCCDAWVVWALPDAVRAYAETLLDTLDFLQQSDRPEPLLASGLGNVPDLRRRLTMIMTGTSRRLPGRSGKLGLLMVAGAMLPLGATWAQKADEPKEVRVVVKTDDGKLVEGAVNEGALSFNGTVDVQNTTDVLTPQSSSEQKVVILRVDSQDKLSDKVELSGSMEDVIKELETLIAKSKRDATATDAAKDRIKGLHQALDALKRAGHPVGSKTIHGGVLPEPKDGQTLNVRVIERVQKDGPAGKNSAEVAQARREISKLKEHLKATMDQLIKAQAKLTELGEDSGEKPVLEWRLSQKNPRIELKTYTVTRPLQHTRLVPSMGLNPQIEVRRVEERTRALKPADSERLELLEKRMKALQDELDRLKRSSGPREAK
jgi:beta-lactamase regulating signal transducer with metallopeptidase domain